MLEGTLANTSTFIEEAVQEVFEYLRPRNSRYKTNTEFEIGKRVILSWAVERKWDGGFHVNTDRQFSLDPSAISRAIHERYVHSQGRLLFRLLTHTCAVKPPNASAEKRLAPW
jgi:hypothetical protein